MVVTDDLVRLLNPATLGLTLRCLLKAFHVTPGDLSDQSGVHVARLETILAGEATDLRGEEFEALARRLPVLNALWVDVLYALAARAKQEQAETASVVAAMDMAAQRAKALRAGRFVEPSAGHEPAVH